jgi:hypothetical protein
MRAHAASQVVQGAPWLALHRSGSVHASRCRARHGHAAPHEPHEGWHVDEQLFGPSTEDLIVGLEGAPPGYPRVGACGQQQPSRCPRRHSVATGRWRHCSEMHTLQVCGPESAPSRGRVAWGQTLSICPPRRRVVAPDGSFRDTQACDCPARSGLPGTPDKQECGEYNGPFNCARYIVRPAALSVGRWVRARCWPLAGRVYTMDGHADGRCHSSRVSGQCSLLSPLLSSFNCHPLCCHLSCTH